MQSELRKAYEEVFGKVKDPFILYDFKGNRIYFEYHGLWCKQEYDYKLNEYRYEDSDGYVEYYELPREGCPPRRIKPQNSYINKLKGS